MPWVGLQCHTRLLFVVAFVVYRDFVMWFLGTLSSVAIILLKKREREIWLLYNVLKLVQLCIYILKRKNFATV